jgi:predicted phage baseplate assembly protein
LPDYERLALDVPGAPIARARAWAGLDPTYPGLKAPGTIAVVIVPWLPQRCPQPCQGLIAAVYAFLNRRRIIGTRIVVAGPRYLKVSVRATVAIQPGSRRDRVHEQVIAALDRFLDPLSGGPDGRGWPFGRDVYRAEILEVIDRTPGVDHVEALELVPDPGTAQCGNLCVGPFWLVRPGDHSIQLPGGGDYVGFKT